MLLASMLFGKPIFRQIALDCSVRLIQIPQNGTTGSPFLIPAYEVNELAFGVPEPFTVPEPGSLGLLAAALAIAAYPTRRRRRSNSTSGG